MIKNFLKNLRSKFFFVKSCWIESNPDKFCWMLSNPVEICPIISITVKSCQILFSVTCICTILSILVLFCFFICAAFLDCFHSLVFWKAPILLHIKVNHYSLLKLVKLVALVNVNCPELFLCEILSVYAILPLTFRA